MNDILGDHEHDEFPLEEQEHPFWKLDTIELTSIGIDIGTATTLVLLSRLVLRRLGHELSSRYIVTERQVLYQSPVYFTPYTANREKIDDEALGRLIDAAYKETGINPEDIDTGAVILTGEAIRRDNAAAIANLLAAQGGKFVCASAGHNFEAMLGAFGSGAVALSSERECRVLNIDIGGGTTKLVVAERGRILSTAAFHIGGRLLATDSANVITLLEPGGQVLARQIGFEWQLGDQVATEEVERLADYMARTILTLVRNENPTPELKQFWLTPPLSDPKSYDAVVFCGGVGEYIYGRENKSFGDMGAPLGKALQHYISDGALPWPLMPARECIRSTVIGASQYTVQVSGNTIYYSDEKLLPLKNLQVLRPALDLSGDIDATTVAQSILNRFRDFDLKEGEAKVVLVFSWDGLPTAARIAAFCRGLTEGLPNTLKHQRPIYLVFDFDLARLVGTILKEEFHLKNDILSVDGITLRDFDFIDVGEVLKPSGTVPVSIKSLLFRM